MKRFWLRLSICGLLGSASACSDNAVSDGSGANANCPQPTGNIELSGKLSVRDWNSQIAGDHYLLDVSSVGVGKSQEWALSLSNVADASSAKAITISSVTLTETDEAGAIATTPQFSCIGPDGKDCATSTFPALVPTGYDVANCAPGAVIDAQKLTIRYTRPANAKARFLTLTLGVVGDSAFALGPKSLGLEVQFGAPKLKCSPDRIDFGQVTGTPAPLVLSCVNSGTAPAQVTGLEIKGKWNGTVSLGDKTATTAAKWQAASAQTGVEVAPGTTAAISVALDPAHAAEKGSATLLVTTTDPALAQVQVPLLANTTGPCLDFSPSDVVDLGQVPLTTKGTKTLKLTNCNAVEPLDLTGIKLQDGATTGLAVVALVGCGTVSGLPTPTSPWTLNPKQTCSVEVQYQPSGAGVNAVGTVQVDLAEGGTKTLPVKAQGVAVSCGQACFTIKTSSNQPVTDSTTTQTPLLLDGGCSTAAPGQTVATWNWSLVKAPEESVAGFTPSAIGQNVSFLPVISGTYTIKLETLDSAGAPGCQPKTFDLLVVPDDKLHIELTWVTPTDKIKTDKIGTDMDLHLANANAYKAKLPDLDGNGEPDPWGSLCDCYTANASTKWGEPVHPEQDAYLNLDDNDGWGPEIINVNTPVKGSPYTIGVHYWLSKAADANGVALKDPATGQPYPNFGPSTPRVRVFLDANATPAYDLTGPEMTQGDMWCVGKITWSPNGLTKCTGADASGVLMTHKYQYNWGGNTACD